ncbi:APC family permease [Bacillus sp. FSL M8-0168]|uniref:APC family permease n=1 Tax=Bacillus sp. FSL M8-0168 TaxID=2921614 RepID=UPI0030FD48B6
MKEKKLGSLLLSGLMTGPILGSGVILLPPMVHEIAGDYAIFAWLFMMGAGFLFAWIFAILSIQYPNDAGIAYAAEKAFGIRAKKLAVLYFITAASFGPAAVLMTAGQYIHSIAVGSAVSTEVYSLLLFIICLIVLCFRISFVGKVSFVFSSAAAVLLLGGSFTSIPFFREGPLIEGAFRLADFGHGLLLLFWALVGWEMIGNYSMEVKDRRKVIPRAVVISGLMVTLVYLAIAGAAQWIDPGRFQSGQLKLTLILTPLFGPYALAVIAAVTSVLCMSTYLLVVGGAARLISSQTAGVLAYRTKDDRPIAALGLIFAVHASVFVCLFFHAVNVDTLVAIANAFFICHSLCGLLAAYRLLGGFVYKAICVFLIGCFSLLLLFSSLPILCFVMFVTAIFALRSSPLKDTRYEQL